MQCFYLDEINAYVHKLQVRDNPPSTFLVEATDPQFAPSITLSGTVCVTDVSYLFN